MQDTKGKANTLLLLPARSGAETVVVTHVAKLHGGVLGLEVGAALGAVEEERRQRLLGLAFVASARSRHGSRTGGRKASGV